MSLKVTVNEDPRRFSVNIGRNTIGRVTSCYQEGESPTEAYQAERPSTEEDGEWEFVGWFDSLKEAAVAIIEYAHGPVTIDSINERVV